MKYYRFYFLSSIKSIMKHLCQLLVLVGATCILASDELQDKVEKDDPNCDDDETYYEYPCDNCDDNIEECVRSFFDTNATCSVVWCSNDEPVYKDTQIAYLPACNSSYVCHKVYLSGLNGTIEAFYFNRKTGNLIMSVNFEGIVFNSTETNVVIHRRSKEPKVIKMSACGIYPVILTAVIPVVENRITFRDLQKAVVSAYAPKKHIEYNIGPVECIEHPDVTPILETIKGNIPTVIQEVFLTCAPDFFLEYLQNHICDYGLDQLFHTN